jgi:DNA-binding CsgD family transcriptional regulator/nucleoid-associated protein YgaU
LSARLKRCVYALMVLLASWAVILAVSPAVAEAQGIARTKDAQQIGTERVVVSPGDSLWSISEERLGPNATPQQIASEAERIYALNQNQIGADPNLIFPGQKLLAPPVVGEPSTAEPSTGATPARGATEPAEASPTGRAANSGTADQASRTPIGTTDGKGERASDPVAEPVNLPEVAAAAPVPAVRSLAAKASPHSPVESFARTVRSAVSGAESAVVGAFPRDDYLGRKLLGLGIVLLTLIVCGLMAWKLPMRRNVGDSAAWGIPREYPNYRADPEALDRYADASAEASPTYFGSRQSLGGSDNEVTVAENDLGRVGIVGAVRGRRERIRRRRAPKRIGRKRAPRAGRRSREGSVTGAYSPKIYRALSRAALETRPQRSANGRAKGTRREEGADSARALLRKPEIVGNGHKPLGLVGNEVSRPDQRIHLLSARQREILELVAEGLPNAQIAQRLFVTESTVKQHLHKAYRTLGVRNRREAAKSLSSNDRAERRPVTAVGVRL